MDAKYDDTWQHLISRELAESGAFCKSMGFDWLDAADAVPVADRPGVKHGGLRWMWLTRPFSIQTVSLRKNPGSKALVPSGARSDGLRSTGGKMCKFKLCHSRLMGADLAKISINHLWCDAHSGGGDGTSRQDVQWGALDGDCVAMGRASPDGGILGIEFAAGGINGRSHLCLDQPWSGDPQMQQMCRYLQDAPLRHPMELWKKSHGLIPSREHWL